MCCGISEVGDGEAGSWSIVDRTVLSQRRPKDSGRAGGFEFLAVDRSGLPALVVDAIEVILDGALREGESAGNLGIR